ncbi:RraA family protein [Arenibacterium sp. LLYu02]|uniref:RraA family protein n=1 Tax=Arenibacterium sp. LLYu02 TaxID=3404132 RepID=UPI003B223831
MSHSDETLFQTIRDTLFTSVIGDVMDAAGLTHQFLPPAIRALRPNDMLVGRAMPVLEADCASDVGARALTEPFGLMFRALDELKTGEVYICTGSSPRYALWGELMATRALSLGAAGAVLDGFHRDTKGLLNLPFPVFSQGSYAQDQRVRGRVVDYGCPIEFPNATRVHPGDLVVGDIDGVLIVPSAHVDDIVAAALAKVEGEEMVRQRILGGQSTQAIFDETGIM